MNYDSLNNKTKLKTIWDKLYQDKHNDLFENLYHEIETAAIQYKQPIETNIYWYKNAVVYALYVDLFAGNFEKLTKNLSYFKNLGVNCLWLLPILESPMKDAGFDVSDYKKIRCDLLGKTCENKPFLNFLHEANSLGIKIIFDIPVNHTSDQHHWFLEAKKSQNNKYRDYYIWSKDASEYLDCRLIFEGMCNSNWEACNGEYYFHRFFEFQPDLNYKNPAVLVEMVKTLLFWVQKGISGFRIDAIPYLWKTEGTDCENLPETHLLVKFFRAAIEIISPNILLLAEACQKPNEVVKYFGNSDECHAAYHFPLMPMIFKSIATENSKPIIDILNEQNTPKIPDNCQWFTFLRVHDELSLEKVYVDESDRQLLYNYYCKNPEWDFRLGQGISARLSELMDNSPRKLLLAFSILLSLPGTPLIYYGDEFAKKNDKKYFDKKIKETGKIDTRFLVRGKLDLINMLKKFKENNSIENIVFYGIKQMLEQRKTNKSFISNNIKFISAQKEILSFIRYYDNQSTLFIHNLSSKPQCVKSILKEYSFADLIGNSCREQLNAYEYLWLKINF